MLHQPNSLLFLFLDTTVLPLVVHLVIPIHFPVESVLEAICFAFVVGVLAIVFVGLGGQLAPDDLQAGVDEVVQDFKD